MASWFEGLRSFAHALNRPRDIAVSTVNGGEPGWMRNWMIGFTIFYSAVPLLLAMDLAHTSNTCDALMDQLNAARMKYGQDKYAMTPCAG